MGGEIGVEFSHHTHRSWMRWLAKCSPSLSRNSYAEEVVRVMKPLLLDKRSVLADGAEPIGGTLVHKPRDIIIWGRILTGPTPLCRQFLPFPDIGRMPQLLGGNEREWHQGGTPNWPRQYDKHLECLGKTKTNRVQCDPKCDPTNLK